MGLEQVRNKAQGIAINAGRATLHAMAPDDFEYYACVMQLVNSQGEIVQIFNFPVMPNAMSLNKRPLVNIKKTARGYLDQFSTSFSGDVISISGTFGRKFRLLISNDNNLNEAKKGKGTEQLKDFVKNTFDAKVKTGYGALKLLEKIIYKSTELDEFNQPHRLFFYNFAFNESFLVEVVNWGKQQSLENNIMWNYSLEMKALANADTLESAAASNGKSNIKNLLATAALQKSLNKTFNNLTAQGTTDALKNIFV